MNNPSCPSSDVLAGYAFGTLEDGLADSIADHLVQCSACETHLGNLENSADDLLDKLRQPPPEDPYMEEPNCSNAVVVISDPSNNTPKTGEEPTALFRKEFGQYRVGEKLGAGGMGTVYEALHLSLNRTVAIKLLPAESLKKTALVTRFQREMQAVGQLSHPNIVAAHDAGEVDGIPYLVMELVEGANISEWARRGEPLEIADVCELVRQAAVGMDYAHRQGMVHRDLKPSNLMLTETEAGEPLVKVLDLGLALLEEKLPEEFELTGAGHAMGTVEYMAPEQCIDSHDVDARADIYSLGATLYKLLCGEAPFPASRYRSPMQLMMARANQAPPTVLSQRDVPVELSQLVEEMLERDPERRPRTAAEVAERLAPFAERHQLVGQLRTDDTKPLSPSRADAPAMTATVHRTGDVDTVPVPGGSGRRRQRVLWALIVPILIGLAAVIWLKTDGGYLKIEADPSISITVEVMRDGQPMGTIDVGRDAESVWYRAGDYEIRLPAESRDKLTLSEKTFTLKHRRRKTVTITQVPVRIAEAPSNSPPAVSSTAKKDDPPKPKPKPKLNPSAQEQQLEFARKFLAEDRATLTVELPSGELMVCRARFSDIARIPEFRIVELTFIRGKQYRDDEFESRLVEASKLGTVEHVRIDAQDLLTVASYRALLKHFPRLKSANFFDEANVAWREVAPILVQFSELESLDFEHAKAVPWTVDVAKIRTLKRLRLYQSKLDVEGIHRLAKLPALECLHLNGSDVGHLIPIPWESLKELPRLKRLEFGAHVNVSEEEIRKFQLAWPMGKVVLDKDLDPKTRLLPWSLQ